MKRDVLRRLAGHRQLFMVDTGPIPVNDEPIVSLNEAFVVFADDQEVLKALQRLRDNAAADPDDVVALIKRMATAANVPINVDDAFIGEPFVPLAPREPAGR